MMDTIKIISQWLDSSYLRLQAGELHPSEVRLIKNVLRVIIRQIREEISKSGDSREEGEAIFDKMKACIEYYALAGSHYIVDKNYSVSADKGATARDCLREILKYQGLTTPRGHG